MTQVTNLPDISVMPAALPFSYKPSSGFERKPAGACHRRTCQPCRFKPSTVMLTPLCRSGQSAPSDKKIDDYRCMKGDPMGVKAVDFRKRLEKKWTQRLERKRNCRSAEYASDNKLQVLCKCPRCEKEHEKLMQWTGRGMPRVYCQVCRPLVASVCDTVFAKSGGSRVKSSHAVDNY